MLVHRFRSTAAFDLRHRSAVPAIDRATFVVFSLGNVRVALPVEVVERVLRKSETPRVDDGPQLDGARTPHVSYQGQPVPIASVRHALHLETAPTPGHLSRWLIVTVMQSLIAIEVEAVHEVATLDASVIRAVPAETHGWWFDQMATEWPIGTRGIFARQGHEVVILDILRLMRP